MLPDHPTLSPTGRSPSPTRAIGGSVRAIVIGASTGGVEALYTVLSSLPSDCPPVCVVQHMRAGYLGGFVSGLNRACSAEVCLAEDRTPFAGGTSMSPRRATCIWKCLVSPV